MARLSPWLSEQTTTIEEAKSCLLRRVRVFTHNTLVENQSKFSGKREGKGREREKFSWSAQSDGAQRCSKQGCMSLTRLVPVDDTEREWSSPQLMMSLFGEGEGGCCCSIL